MSFKVGDRVSAVNSRYPGSGVVTKVNPRTIAVTLDDGHKVRYDRIFLVPEGEKPTDLHAGVLNFGGGPVEMLPYVPAPQPGTIVRCSPAAIMREPRLNGLWIVTGGQGDKSRLFRINNTDGRYWRVRNNDLIKVNATLTEV